MATAKSLTATELQTVLAYTATQPNAQRNRAMLLMTVAAGLRVGEVAGLTLGDVLDSTGAVRGEVFLASHRVKHQHARTIYIKSWLTTLAHAPTSPQNFHCFQLIAVHAATFHPTRWHSTFTICTNGLVLATPVVILDARHF